MYAAPLVVAPLVVQERPAARAAPLLGEQRLERRHGVDLATAGPARELRHPRIVADGQIRPVDAPARASGRPSGARTDYVGWGMCRIAAEAEQCRVGSPSSATGRSLGQVTAQRAASIPPGRPAPSFRTPVSAAGCRRGARRRASSEPVPGEPARAGDQPRPDRRSQAAERERQDDDDRRCRRRLALPVPCRWPHGRVAGGATCGGRAGRSPSPGQGGRGLLALPRDRRRRRRRRGAGRLWAVGRRASARAGRMRRRAGRVGRGVGWRGRRRLGVAVGCAVGRRRVRGAGGAGRPGSASGSTATVGLDGAVDRRLDGLGGPDGSVDGVGPTVRTARREGRRLAEAACRARARREASRRRRCGRGRAGDGDAAVRRPGRRDEARGQRDGREDEVQEPHGDDQTGALSGGHDVQWAPCASKLGVRSADRPMVAPGPVRTPASPAGRARTGRPAATPDGSAEAAAARST